MSIKIVNLYGHLLTVLVITLKFAFVYILEKATYLKKIIISNSGYEAIKT